MRSDRFDGAAFGFVLVVQDVIVRAVDVLQARRRARIKKTPFRIGFDAFHEEVRYPEGVEQVAGAEVLVALVAFEVEDLKDIGVVRLDVDRAAAFAFAGLETERVRRWTTQGGDTSSLTDLTWLTYRKTSLATLSIGTRPSLVPLVDLISEPLALME